VGRRFAFENNCRQMSPLRDHAGQEAARLAVCRSVFHGSVLFMRHTVIGLFAASAILACAAVAQAQTANPPAEPAAAPAEDKMVCVTEDAGGNSRLGSSRRVCHTQKEWDSLPRSRR
jgi:hypothetical protein